MTVLHVREYGNPLGRPVLAIHGVSAHAQRWERLALEAWPHLRTIAVDLRGHGQSPWTPPWSIEQHMRDIVDTLDAVGVTDPVDVVGHSYGGAIALRLLEHHPGRIGKVALLDPALDADPIEMAALADAALRFEGWATVDEALVARNAGLGDELHPAVPIDVEQHLVQGDDGRYRFRFLPLAVAASYGELCHPIPRFEPRSMVLVRATQAAWVTPSVIEALRSRLGDHLRVVDVDSGHMVYWQRFAETAAAVLALLDS
jgi:lipase